MSSAEIFLNHLDNIFHKEPLFFRAESKIRDVPGVTTFVYKDYPEKGFVTGVTYGLSLVNHPSWKLGHPELCICAESDRIEWGHVIGYIANKLRGDCPFSYGQTINFDGLIADDSDMDAFLVFAPSIFENKEDYLNIEIGEKNKISIAQMYPIYSSEIKVLENIGLKEFWHHPNFELYNISRNQIEL